MVSVDTLEDNKAFALKEHADFPMLANPDKKVAMAYGVIAPDAPPERQFARRYTYYIDPTGKIAARKSSKVIFTSRCSDVAKAPAAPPKRTDCNPLVLATPPAISSNFRSVTPNGTS